MVAGGFEVFLKYLPGSADEDGVRSLFQKCGEIAGDVRLMRDFRTGQCKGAGWITFAQKSGAEAACKMDGVLYDKRHVQVTMAKQVSWAGGHAATVGGIHGTVQAAGTHTPAMGKEVVAALVSDERDGVYVDGTFGRGGHTQLILKALGPKGRLHAFDLDPEAVKEGKELERKDSRFRIHHGGFKSMASVLPAAGVGAGTVAGVFLDLGISSPQLDEAARGFRPEQSGPLDLRFDLTRGPSASDFLRDAPREELLRVLREYGDPSDPHAARRVADAICLARLPGGAGAPRTTKEFSDLVASCRGYEYQAMHAAKATFQALRIHLNDEFGQLRGGVAASLEMLKPNGRVGVLTWKHSECALLVDYLRRVEVAPPSFPLLRWQKSRSSDSDWVSIDKRWGFVADSAQRPTAEEMRDNSRSRSAVLHVLRKRKGILCSDLERTAAAALNWGEGDAVAQDLGSCARADIVSAESTEVVEPKAPKKNKKKTSMEVVDEEDSVAETGRKRKRSSADAEGEQPACKAKRKKGAAAPAEELDGAAGTDDRSAADGKREKPCASDTSLAAASAPEHPDASEVGTLYEDEDVLAINKPAGMLCHPSPGYWDHGTVVHALGDRIPAKMQKHRESYTGEDDSFIPRAIVHRLDKGTTGVLLVAKTPAAEQQLTEQFKGRSMKKRYVALLLGHPGGAARSSTIHVNEPIGRDPARAGKMAVTPDGKAAKSVVRVHAYSAERDISLVTVELLTGRQHQIRVHCGHLGAAVAGDNDYAEGSALAAFRKAFKKLPSKRPLLHCWRMQLSHPARASEPLTVEAPLPPDMCQVVAKLWPGLSLEPQAWPEDSAWRVKLRGLPFAVEVQEVLSFLAPKLEVSADAVRLPRKNAKKKYLKEGDLRPGEAEVLVRATREAIDGVKELHSTHLGSRWIEVSVDQADSAT